MLKKTILFSTALLVSLNCSALGYYDKGNYIPLAKASNKADSQNFGSYTTEQGELKLVGNRIIVKTQTKMDASYFEHKYGVSTVRFYGKVFIFETESPDKVLDIAQKIYENEPVKYAQPSFAQKRSTQAIKLGNLVFGEKGLEKKITSHDFITPHANEDTLSMLDSENSINYWKYYDDVFRYHDESYWHLHNKGGYVAQAYYSSGFYDVLSVEDVDADVLEVIDSGLSGKGVRVAVVDSSFELTHPDLSFSDSFNFDIRNKDVTPNSIADFHGTAVAGVIGANRGNNYATMGVAPDAYPPQVTPVSFRLESKSATLMVTVSAEVAPSSSVTVT